MQNQAKIIALRQSLAHTIVGQTALLDRLVIALLCGGHILLEGLPGLGKTTAVKALAGGVTSGGGGLGAGEGQPVSRSAAPRTSRIEAFIRPCISGRVTARHRRVARCGANLPAPCYRSSRTAIIALS